MGDGRAEQAKISCLECYKALGNGAITGFSLGKFGLCSVGTWCGVRGECDQRFSILIYKNNNDNLK